MKKLINISLLGVCLMMLCYSCTAPLALIGLVSSHRQGMNDIAINDDYMLEKPDIWMEDSYQTDSDFYLGLVNMTDEGENIVYVGEGNEVELYLPEDINPENLVFSSTLGRLEKGTADGFYVFYIEEAGMEIEITVTDTVSGLSGSLLCYSEHLPLPTAYLELGDNGTMTADKFKQQKALNLDMSGARTSISCDCKSFVVTRIGKDGKREELDNRSNGFSEQLKALVAKAMPGDMYIFSKIKAECSGYAEPKHLKNFVYTIE